MGETKIIKASDLPYRPLSVKLINSVGGLCGKFGLEPIKLERDALINKAIKKAGSRDFGGDDFIEGMDRLIKAIKTEAQPTFLGKAMAEQIIVADLVDRLRMTDYINKHPEVQDEEIRKPLFINGLPRSGTTILYELLDVDPANRSPISWELDVSVPPSTPATRATDPRIPACHKKFENMFKLAPGIHAVHEMGAELPQECVGMFQRNFRSQGFVTLFDVPSYNAWIDTCSFISTYKLHKKYLQLMQSGGVRGERWLLKSPQHVHLLDDMLAVYPDANIIHTHRNPVDVVVSVSSLFAILRSMGSDQIDTQYIGRQSLDWWDKLVKITVDQRKRHCDKAEQFIDLKFKETVADPIAAVERIYDHFNYELRTDVKIEMEKFMKRKTRDRHGSHTYTDEEFGIDRQRDGKRFEHYCEYFNI